ncbi:alpha/beta fold hydrolase [Chryseosolibacter indicus]|uniref:Alpha/beta hydrolase n=1 Tax=Chryseosolibacter indicus TaxID=2782351 RepID=A0ABS5VU25_9BACT|nr:alpha/beta hydrolase [Chryseosolibacter indicus]MBT1704696.1 alpha/beta hydrolase [Chryseosolibacter indicus]
METFNHANGITLHCSEEGEGNKEAIIFLHGFPEYGGAWKKQLDFMASVGYHAIAPDQRGYNMSSKPEGVKAYIIDNLVADIVALIGTRKVFLVGHDWGGCVAWEVAIRHPSLLKKLVILNMPHPAVMLHEVKTNPKQMIKSWYQALFQLPVLPELLLKVFNFKFLERSLLNTSIKGTFDSEDLTRYKHAWQQPNALTSMLHWYRAFKYYKSTNDVTVNVPTLIIWGKKDQFLSAEMAEKSKDHCANGKLVMLQDATHWLHHEKTEKVNKLILEFIQEA